MEWSLAGGVVAAALALPLALYLMQDRLIFHPRPLPDAARAALAQRFAPAASIHIDAPDGVRLHAWHLRGAPLVLYFGGNAEEVSWMLSQAAAQAPGTGWLLVDYRGYGASGGEPSESALVADALLWHDHATRTLGARELFVFGRSLGSGVAVQVAASRPVNGVIAVAPFDSLTAVAGHYYPYLPVRWMLRHPFDSLERATALRVPLLCLVAERDEVIPLVHSKRLFEAWGGPKRWVLLEGAGHNSTDDAPAFWRAIREFLVQSH